MPYAVILEHAVPGQPVHLDLMIEDTSLPGEHRLRSWRVDDRPDRSLTFQGEQIGNHRAAYLRYEGEISGGRGSVRRLARGEVLLFSLTEHTLEFEIFWERGARTGFHGSWEDGEHWRFTQIRG